MIYPELQGYLMGVVSPDDLAQFDAGFALLEAYQVDEYMTPFDTIIGEVSQQGDTAVVDNIRATLRSMLVMLVQMHGVALHDDNATLRVPIQFAEVLLKFGEWNDLATLHQLVTNAQSSGEDNESIFAEVCGYIAGRPTEEYLPFLEVVSTDLINGLLQLGMVEEGETISAEVEAELRSYLADYKSIRDRGTSPHLWADWVLHSPLAFGMPFEAHLQRFVAERHDQLTNMVHPEQYQQLAEELLAIAAISHERLAQALPLVRAHASELFSDLNQTRQLDAVMTKLFMEVTNRAAT